MKNDAATGLLVFLVEFYRKALSPLFPASCRFYPSCSEYSVEALKEHGALAGTRMTVGRIIRCVPFCRGGYDPAVKKKKR